MNAFISRVVRSCCFVWNFFRALNESILNNDIYLFSLIDLSATDEDENSVDELINILYCHECIECNLFFKSMR